MQSKISVIDDEEQVRNTIRMQLSGLDHEISEASDGGEGMALLNASNHRLTVDAIICDLRMPKIDGHEAIAYFRREYPKIPILVLTGFPDVNMATEFMKQGVVDYIVKPVEKEKLVEAVEKAVRERTLFP